MRNRYYAKFKGQSIEEAIFSERTESSTPDGVMKKMSAREINDLECIIEVSAKLIPLPSGCKHQWEDNWLGSHCRICFEFN